MTVLNQAVIMALLIITGVLCYNIKIITKESAKSLSSLVLMVVNPLILVVSYQIPYKKELLNGLLWTLGLSFASIIIAIILSYIFIRKKRENLPIERFSAVYSNCAFMGVPLVNGIYGNEGVFYLTAFVTVFNILVWTHGVFLMKGKFKIKMIAEAFRTPAIIAAVIAFLLFIFKIKIPETPLKAMNYIADMNTPLAMIAAGAYIAQTNVFKALKNYRLYLTGAVKLIAVPLAAALLFSLLPINKIVTGTAVLASACPTAVTCTLFAIRFKKDALYASEIFAVTTLMSIIILPLIMAITEKII